MLKIEVGNTSFFMNFRIYLVGLVKYFWKGRISTFVPNEKKSFLAESEVFDFD